MNISRDSYFYRYVLDVFDDAPRYEVDSCRMFWLMLRNLVMVLSFLLFIFVIGFTILYSIVSPFLLIFLGKSIDLVLFSLGITFIGLIVAAIVSSYSYKFQNPVIESFKAWKNKFCIKFEVV